jgi:hypothetical protein
MKLAHVRFLIASAAALMLLAGASSAGAFSVTSVTVTPRAIASGEPGFGVPGLVPADPASSGAHPALDIVATFDTDGGTTTAQTIVQHLGTGIVANPHATATCSRADFAVGSPAPVACAATTQVGVSTVTVLLPGPTTAGLPAKVYNLEPLPGAPAALGIAIDLTSLGFPGAFRKNIAEVTVDPADLGLTSTLTGLAASPPIVAISLSLWGYAATGSTPALLPYFTSPTACATSTVSVTATSYSSQTSTNSGSYTPTACDTAPFDTALTIGANPSSTDSLSAISVDVRPAPVFVPRVTSYIKQNTVVLPPGTLLNPALAASLDACTDAQFARSDPSVTPSCPASSQVGTVTFVSPSLGAFPGTAYFGTGNATDTLRLFLDVPLFGAHIKVIGGVRPDKATGQVTTVFDDLPQVAFTSFRVDFNGPPLSVFTTPTTCGTHTGSALNLPYSGGPASMPTASFDTSYDGAGAPCVTSFRPWLDGALSNANAGASTSYTLRFGRPDRDTRIDRATFRLPAGLVGDLTLDGLVKCSLSDAAKAACGDASKVGTAQVEVGSGPAPASLPGTVYLTAPQQAGDPAGLSVLVPAKLGPVDLANVIVPVRLQLRGTGGLTATSAQLPQLQEGITTSLRVASIAITRDGFMRNPTGCGRKRYSGTFDALGGGNVTAFDALTITDCDALPFAPRISAKLGAKGRNGAGAHPPFTTTIRQRGGEASIRRANVRLPKTLSTNIDAIDAACTRAELDAGTCSKRARVGRATAISPLIDGPVTGPVYLVKRPEGGLPKVVVQLRDPIALQFEGVVRIGKGNRITTLFPRIPDLPVSKFTLAFHSGRFGILSATRSLCAKTLRMPTKFHGYNGDRESQRPKIAVKGCRR